MLHRPGICFCHGEEKSKMLVGISQIFISATFFVFSSFSKLFLFQLSARSREESRQKTLKERLQEVVRGIATMRKQG